MDRQLDDLGQALDFLEGKSDKLNQEARQLITDAKAARVAGDSPGQATPGERGVPKEGKAKEEDSNTPIEPNSQNVDTT